MNGAVAQWHLLSVVGGGEDCYLRYFVCEDRNCKKRWVGLTG